MAISIVWRSLSPEAPEDVGLGLAILSRWPIRHSWTHRLPSSRAERPVALVAAVDHPDAKAAGPMIPLAIHVESKGSVGSTIIERAWAEGRTQQPDSALADTTRPFVRCARGRARSITWTTTSRR